MRFSRLIAGAALFLAIAPLAWGQTAPPAQAPILTNTARFLPVIAKHGMVASQEKLATRVGVEILKAGGNAVDAAVAVGFALAVTHPQAGNIGGGGFMLVHLAARNETIAIDYRETAPAAMSRDVFLDGKGETDPRKSRDSALGIGVPGTVAGLALAHERYGSGKFTLAQLIAPAVKLAREGFPVDGELADTLPRAQPRLARWPASARIFLKPDGDALGHGDRLVQADLAASLEMIAAQGPRAFYEGSLADRIVAGVRENGGILTRDDLKDYRAIVRPAARGTYRGYDIASMPPPSSGGVHLIEMLNILEGFPLRATGAESAATLHLMIEAMKPAYADRAEFLGDPAFVTVPVTALTSKRYAATLRSQIDPERARPSQTIRAGNPAPHEGDNTTHYSVMDAEGNAVANTYTLNFFYGLGLVADGTGILLNNELDDFAAKAGAANAFGLVGGDANAPGPGKRPLSSMSPTIVTRDGRVLLVTGTHGGSRIITMVLQVILNVIDHQMNIAEAVAAPRIHHQWLPDQVDAERGLSPDTIRLLEARGHKIAVGRTFGSANSILVTPEGLTGTADPRQRGTLAEGY
ncbi:MAG: gamma-glutamyltransferase [Alphaproteobacteria bacterium]|nr:MAG: gamma-glutamyltransferase [Alphaproteobacteria bacterium]